MNTNNQCRDSDPNRFKGIPNLNWRRIKRETLLSNPNYRAKNPNGVCAQETKEWSDSRKVVSASGLSTYFDLFHPDIQKRFKGKSYPSKNNSSMKTFNDFKYFNGEIPSRPEGIFDAYTSFRMEWGKSHESCAVNDLLSSLDITFIETAFHSKCLTIKTKKISDLFAIDVLAVKITTGEDPKYGDPTLFYYGASPDGIAVDKDGNESVVEIKCPVPFYPCGDKIDSDYGLTDTESKILSAYSSRTLPHSVVPYFYIPQMRFSR